MIGFTINDRATPVLDWKLDAETDQGDRSATGKLPGDVTWAEQDAPIVAWRGADDPLWSEGLDSARWVQIRSLAERLIGRV